MRNPWHCLGPRGKFLFVSLIFIFGGAAFITALITIGRNFGGEPTVYIKDLYVPALNKTTTFNSTSVLVDLKFQRDVAFTRRNIKHFVITLLYGNIEVDYMVQGFSMGRTRKVHEEVKAVRIPWEEVSRELSIGKMVTIVVEVKGPDFSSVVARVKVDDSGHMYDLQLD